MHLVQHLNYHQILLFGQAALTMTSVAHQIEGQEVEYNQYTWIQSETEVLGKAAQECQLRRRIAAVRLGEELQ